MFSKNFCSSNILGKHFIYFLSNLSFFHVADYFCSFFKNALTKKQQLILVKVFASFFVHFSAEQKRNVLFKSSCILLYLTVSTT
jgi:hypothetical protein